MLDRLTLGALLALGLLTLAVGTRWGPLMDLDHQVARAAFDATSGHARRVDVWQAVSEYVGPHVLRIAMLVGAGLLAVTRRFAAGVWLAALSFLEAEVAPASKLLLERPRPSWADPITTVGATSFPSGHATAAATAGVALMVVGLAVVHARDRRIAVLVAGVALVVAVAASRVFLGVHYLSDVAGGVALGTALTASTAWLLLRIRPDALGRR